MMRSKVVKPRGHYINTHFTKIINERVRYCLRTTSRRSPSGVIVQGPTGIGKTTLLELIQETINNEYIKDGLLPPVYIVGAPTLPSTKEYYSEILDALGDHNAFFGTANAIKVRLFERLVAMQVKVLIFDEFQQLVEKRGEKVVHQTMDDIKRISDDFQIACVFVGTNKVAELTEINEQIASRFGQVININYMRFSSAKSQAITCKFMDEYVKAHNILGMDFSSYEASLRMFAATNGDLRIFVNLLDDATGFLTGSSMRPLTLPELGRAYSLMPKNIRLLGRSNPFSVDVSVIEDILKVTDLSAGGRPK